MPAPSVIDATWRNKWNTDVVVYFAGLGSPVAIRTAYPNAPFSEPNTGVWARLTVQVVDSTHVEFGNPRRYRDSRILVAQLFCEAEQGQSALDPVIDRITSVFRDVVENELRWRVPRSAQIGRDGKWHQANVWCPFDTDTLVSG